MIPSRIEIGALGFGTSLYIHYGQFLFPSRLSLLANGFEVEVRHIVQQVFTGIFCADDGKTYLGQHFAFLTEVSQPLLVIQLLPFQNRLRELKHEIDVLVVHPTTGTSHSHDFIIGSLLQFRFVDEVIGIQDVS